MWAKVVVAIGALALAVFMVVLPSILTTIATWMGRLAVAQGRVVSVRRIGKYGRESELEILGDPGWGPRTVQGALDVGSMREVWIYRFDRSFVRNMDQDPGTMAIGICAALFFLVVLGWVLFRLRVAVGASRLWARAGSTVEFAVSGAASAWAKKSYPSALGYGPVQGRAGSISDVPAEVQVLDWPRAQLRLPDQGVVLLRMPRRPVNGLALAGTVNQDGERQWRPCKVFLVSGGTVEAFSWSRWKSKAGAEN